MRGLLASTLDIDNTAFLGGINMLQPPSSGKIVNQGMLKASDGGYVALVAERVTNDAFISARKGDVLLASGNKVTLVSMAAACSATAWTSAPRRR